MQTLDKRVYDDRLYDADLTDLLDDAETVLSAAVTVDGDSGVVAGAALVNPAPIYYALTRRTAGIGKAVQFRLSAGSLPAGATSAHVPLRLRLVTTVNARLEVPLCLNLVDGGC